MRPSSLVLVVSLATGCAGSDARTTAEEEATKGENRTTASSMTGTDDRYLISDSGIGPVRLGMSLAEARQLLPTATFARTSDGEGIALVQITLAPDTSMIVWAGEDDPDAQIDWRMRIKSIETFSPAFHTPEGVHPGSLVQDVAAAYGGIKEIVMSEIESREYISFQSHPPHLGFRLDYTGVFPPGTRTTNEVRPHGTILSIFLSSSGK